MIHIRGTEKFIEYDFTTKCESNMNIVNWRDCSEYSVHGDAKERSLIGPIHPEKHICPQPPGIYCAHGVIFFNRAVLPANGKLENHVGKYEEIYYILSGTGVFNLNKGNSPCAEGDAVYVPAGSAHGMVNTGNIPLEYLVLGSLSPDI